MARKTIFVSDLIGLHFTPLLLIETTVKVGRLRAYCGARYAAPDLVDRQSAGPTVSDTLVRQG
jgi:hypothetical protein